MPSPFPGMDPYLEGAEWGSAHVALCAEIARQLAPRVRPRYVVRTMRRFVAAGGEDVAISASSMYPDVGVSPRAPTPPRRIRETMPAWSVAPLHLTLVAPDIEPHVAVEVRDAAGHGLVTALELLSLANKRGEGRREYLAKRQRLLASPAHLVEIDLLRAGQRLPVREALPAAPYFVFVSRAEDRPLVAVWPIALDMALPTVPVPLRDPDPDVPLDLQVALSAVYDDLGYDLSLDYSRPPDPPLMGDAAQWAQRQLVRAGLGSQSLPG